MRKLHGKKNVLCELNAFCQQIKQSRPLPATPPSLTFRAFEDKYIDFIKSVWVSADGSIKSLKGKAHPNSLVNVFALKAQSNPLLHSRFSNRRDT